MRDDWLVGMARDGAVGGGRAGIEERGEFAIAGTHRRDGGRRSFRRRRLACGNETTVKTSHTWLPGLRPAGEVVIRDAAALVSIETSKRL